MPLGKGQLRNAKLALLREGTEQERLIEAAMQFWSALFYMDQWPEILQREQAALQLTFLAQGSIPMTVRAMNALQVSAATQQLQAFLDLAEHESRHW